MGDDEVSIKKDAEGPSWGRRDWPPEPNDDLTAALDGQWGPSEETNKIAEKISQVALRVDMNCLQNVLVAQGANPFLAGINVFEFGLECRIISECLCCGVVHLELHRLGVVHAQCGTCSALQP